MERLQTTEKRYMLLRRLVIALAGLGVAFMLARVVINSESTRAEGPEIRTAVVERGDVVSSVTASGTLQPLTTVDVKSNVGGRVDVLTVDVGDRVTKGARWMRPTSAASRSASG